MPNEEPASRRPLRRRRAAAGEAPPAGRPARGARPVRRRPVRRAESEGGGMGYLALFLIFVVGNVILFTTTGWIIIPK
ncbi:MAG: hypothetical protein M5U26_04225 [Planctomycetota bacterium]|nr:hypothetical protein [Planctomycetota bacterium]